MLSDRSEGKTGWTPEPRAREKGARKGKTKAGGASGVVAGSRRLPGCGWGIHVRPGRYRRAARAVGCVSPRECVARGRCSARSRAMRGEQITHSTRSPPPRPKFPYCPHPPSPTFPILPAHPLQITYFRSRFRNECPPLGLRAAYLSPPDAPGKLRSKPRTLDTGMVANGSMEGERPAGVPGSRHCDATAPPRRALFVTCRGISRMSGPLSRWS